MSGPKFKDLRELKDYIKERVQLSDIVARHAKLIKDPKGYKACCPLPGHNEKTPSFHVSTEQDLYYCYGCSRGGDIFTFLEEVEGLSFMDALKELASELDLEMPKNSGAGKSFSKGSSFKSTFDLLERVCKYYQRQLMEGKGEDVARAQDYLTQRGITLEQVERYRLGWAPKGFNLSKKLAGEEAKVAEKLGVIRRSSKGPYDFFQTRLMIPISDFRGKILGFSGRTLDEVDAKNPKYKNSAESEFFKKKELLYGLHQCLQDIRSENYVVICEGFFDQWALSQIGCPSVAVMGTAMTEDHARLIKKYCSEVVLFMDSDQAGRASVLRSIPSLFAQDLDVKIFFPKDSKDPDEWLEKNKDKGLDELKGQLRRSQEALEWWGDLLVSESEKEGLNQLQTLKRLEPVWRCTKSHAHRQILSLRFASSVGMNDRNFISSMNSLISAQSNAQARAPARPVQRAQPTGQKPPAALLRPVQSIDKSAFELLEITLRGWQKLCPNSHKAWQDFEELFEGTIFSGFVKQLASEFAQSHADMNSSQMKQLIDGLNLEESHKNKLLRGVFEGFAGVDSARAEQLRAATKGHELYLKEQKRRREIDALREKIRAQPPGSEETEQLLHRISELLKKENKNLEI